MTFGGNFKTRTVTAIVMVAIVAVLLVLGSTIGCFGRWLLALVAILLISGCALEYVRMARDAGISRTTYFARLTILIAPSLVVFMGLAQTALVCDRVVSASSMAGLSSIAFVAGILLALMLVFISGRGSLEQAGISAQSVLPAMLLIGLGGAALVSITLIDGSWRSLTWMLIVVCCNDIAAYLVGSKVGGPKLCPAISPNKTISGSIGGFVAGLVLAVCFSFLIYSPPISQVICLSLATVFAAQSGDLTKSYLKRQFRVKDSGTILPGHGGMLDRMDGVLMASLVYWAWLISVA